METKQFSKVNKDTYQDMYTKGKAFLRYLMDHVIRFYAYYLKYHMPSGRILGHGCGSGNNSIFFIQQGYDVYGVDVAEASLDQIRDQIRANFEMYSLDPKHQEKFRITSPDATTLPFENGFFDIIISNQVLYYLATEERIRNLTQELSRCLRPDGLVFFTMLGARNYYFTHHTKRIHDCETCEVVENTPCLRYIGTKRM